MTMLIKQSESTAARRRVYFHAVDATDGITAEAGLTGAGRISKNGGATAASTNNIVEVDSTNMPGRYYVEFTAAEVDTLGSVEFRFKTAACAEVVARAQVVLLDPYISAATGVWDAAASSHLVAGTFGQAFQPVRASSLTAASTTVVTLDAGASAQDDFYNGNFILLSPGTSSAQGEIVADYDGTTKQAFLQSALPVAPGSTAPFVMFAGPASVTPAALADQIWDEATAGHVAAGSTGKALGDANTAAAAIKAKTDSLNFTGTDVKATLDSETVTLADASLTSAKFAAGAIDAAAIAADAITDAKVAADVTIASVTGAVGSVAGNVAGSVNSVTGAVGSVTAPVTVGTNNDKTGYALTSGERASIADGVWNEDVGDHLTAGSTGEALSDAGAAGSPPTVEEIADGVLDELLSGHVAAGSLSAALSAILAKAALMQFTGNDLHATLDGETVTLPTGGITSAKFAAGAIDAAAIAADAGTEIANAMWDQASGVEAGLTPRQAVRLIVAANAAKVSGAATGTIVFRNAVADSKNRITATVDADGNRSAVVVDLT